MRDAIGRVGILRAGVFLLVVLSVVGAATTLSRTEAQTSAEAARLFELLELAEGMTVGEIGAGRGEMTVEFARRLGSGGRVYSNEIDPARLGDIREAVSRQNLGNVSVVEAGESTTQFPEGCCDAVFMRDVYHHLVRPDAINRSIVAALKPGGRLAIIDFEPREGLRAVEGVPENRGGHGVRPEIVVEELTGAGLVLKRAASAWEGRNRGNSRMFVVLFEKPR